MQGPFSKNCSLEIAAIFKFEKIACGAGCEEIYFSR
jgi:hypothetical protein